MVSGIESSVAVAGDFAAAGDEEEPCFGSWVFSSFLKVNGNGVFALTFANIPPLLDSPIQTFTSAAAAILSPIKYFAFLSFFSFFFMIDS